MQQFQVPQFITIEDRIIGPLTLRQFLYLLGAAAVTIIGWSLFYFILFLLVAVPIAALFVALAFVKINERPLPTIFFSAINYYLRPRLYLWRKVQESSKPATTLAGKGEPLLTAVPKLSESKLNDLAWSLDIKEHTESTR